MTDDDYRDAEYLRRTYRGADGDRSMAQIAAEHEVATSTIEHWIDKHELGGPMRKATKKVMLRPGVKARLDAHNRDDEAYWETVERALDALEAEA